MGTTLQGRPVFDPQQQTMNVLGFLLRFLSTPEEIDDAVCALHVTFVSEAVVPLHSHRDSQVVYVLEGSIEVFRDTGFFSEWQTLRAGGTISIPGNVKHALRNTSLEPAICIVVTGRELYGFFREVATPFAPGKPFLPPTLEEVEYFLEMADEHGLTLASPAENEAIGLLV
jgi:quercetin dioxygenase-like cupin family protein